MKVCLRNILLVLTGIAFCAGCLSGAIFLWGEVQNNNQGEYVDVVTGAVDLPYMIEMFLVAAVPVTTVVLAAELLLYYLTRVAIVCLKGRFSG